MKKRAYNRPRFHKAEKGKGRFQIAEKGGENFRKTPFSDHRLERDNESKRRTQFKMADTCYLGFQEGVATFLCSEDLGAQVPVKITANGTVAAAADGEAFHGVTAGPARKGYVAVQLTGFVELPLKDGGTNPSLGFAALAAGGNGSVTSGTAGTAGTCLVLGVDSDAKTVGFLLPN